MSTQVLTDTPVVDSAEGKFVSSSRALSLGLSPLWLQEACGEEAPRSGSPRARGALLLLSRLGGSLRAALGQEVELELEWIWWFDNLGSEQNLMSHSLMPSLIGHPTTTDPGAETTRLCDFGGFSLRSFPSGQRLKKTRTRGSSRTFACTPSRTICLC